MTIDNIITGCGITGIVSTGVLVLSQLAVSAAPANEISTVVSSFLSGTGVAGFMLWWLTSRVTTKQDEHSKELESHTRAMNRLTLHMAEIIMLNELATAEMKRMAKNAIEEIKSEATDEGARS